MGESGESGYSYEAPAAESAPVESYESAPDVSTEDYSTDLPAEDAAIEVPADDIPEDIAMDEAIPEETTFEAPEDALPEETALEDDLPEDTLTEAPPEDPALETYPADPYEDTTTSGDLPLDDTTVELPAEDAAWDEAGWEEEYASPLESVSADESWQEGDSLQPPEVAEAPYQDPAAAENLEQPAAELVEDAAFEPAVPEEPDLLAAEAGADDAAESLVEPAPEEAGDQAPDDGSSVTDIEELDSPQADASLNEIGPELDASGEQMDAQAALGETEIPPEDAAFALPADGLPEAEIDAAGQPEQPADQAAAEFLPDQPEAQQDAVSFDSADGREMETQRVSAHEQLMAETEALNETADSAPADSTIGSGEVSDHAPLLDPAEASRSEFDAEGFRITHGPEFEPDEERPVVDNPSPTPLPIVTDSGDDGAGGNNGKSTAHNTQTLDSVSEVAGPTTDDAAPEIDASPAVSVDTAADTTSSPASAADIPSGPSKTADVLSDDQFRSAINHSIDNVDSIKNLESAECRTVLYRKASGQLAEELYLQSSDSVSLNQLAGDNYVNYDTSSAQEIASVKSHVVGKASDAAGTYASDLRDTLGLKSDKLEKAAQQMLDTLNDPEKSQALTGHLPQEIMDAKDQAEKYVSSICSRRSLVNGFWLSALYWHDGCWLLL
jgi:hypothetical protein